MAASKNQSVPTKSQGKGVKDPEPAPFAARAVSWTLTNALMENHCLICAEAIKDLASSNNRGESTVAEPPATPSEGWGYYHLSCWVEHADASEVASLKPAGGRRVYRWRNPWAAQYWDAQSKAPAAQRSGLINEAIRAETNLDIRACHDGHPMFYAPQSQEHVCEVCADHRQMYGLLEEVEQTSHPVDVRGMERAAAWMKKNQEAREMAAKLQKKGAKS
jgi:hypothetical protein